MQASLHTPTAAGYSSGSREAVRQPFTSLHSSSVQGGDTAIVSMSRILGTPYFAQTAFEICDRVNGFSPVMLRGATQTSGGLSSIIKARKAISALPEAKQPAEQRRLSDLSRPRINSIALARRHR
jgi:hypothetical protein